MIDALDLFNAELALAMAYVNRHRSSYGPVLVSEVAPLIGDTSSEWAAERAAAKDFFGTTYAAHRGSRCSLFNVYCHFWHRFSHVADRVNTRMVVNAPHRMAVLDREHGVCYDPRLGALRPVPDSWALSSVDDLVFLSDDGVDAKAMEQMLGLLRSGSTITLVRPGDRCNHWFSRCGVAHDFALLRKMLGRSLYTQVYASQPGTPVMATVFGFEG